MMEYFDLVKKGLTFGQACDELAKNPTFAISRKGWDHKAYYGEKVYAAFCVYNYDEKPKKPQLNDDLGEIYIDEDTEDIELQELDLRYKDFKAKDWEVWRWGDDK